MLKGKIKLLLLAAIVGLTWGLLNVTAVLAQEEEEGEEAEAAEGEGEEETGKSVNAPTPQLMNLDLEWINSDICRLVEELRYTKNPWEKRDIIEQIEHMVYDNVEYPLVFKQAEISDLMNLDRIGTVSDAADAGAATPLAPLIAEAFALYGIAKGYEGYASAANDWMMRAKRIYPNVEDLTVKIDNFQDRLPLKNWLRDSGSYWAKTGAVRVTIEGKNMQKATAFNLNKDNVTFTAKDPNINEYHLAVAQSDFLRGVQRYIVTNDPLSERRPNLFTIYLPPGEYEIKTATSNRLPIALTVSPDPGENMFMVETLEESVTVYPKPKVAQSEEKEEKEQEL